MNYSIEFPVTVEVLDGNQMRISFSTPDDRAILLDGASIDAIREAVEKGGGWLYAQSEYAATIRREGPTYTFNMVP